jgi:hypothetical protein
MLPTMTLEILQVPGCPGADLLAARLDGLLAGRRRVTRRVVASQAEAERLGMTGSPTLLADGADPFARPGLLPSVSCRLYPDEHGQPGPAPSTSQLRATLGLLGPRVTGEVRRNAISHEHRIVGQNREPVVHSLGIGGVPPVTKEPCGVGERKPAFDLVDLEREGNPPRGACADGCRHDGG